MPPLGELSLNEIRRLIQKHNELMTIKIPQHATRLDLVALVRKNGYSIDHAKKRLVPVTQMKRKPVVKLPPAPPKKTEEEKEALKKKKMENKAKKDKTGYDNTQAKIKAVKNVKRLLAFKSKKKSKPEPKKEGKSFKSDSNPFVGKSVSTKAKPKTPTPPKPKTPTPPKPKTPKPPVKSKPAIKSVRAKNLNFVYISTLFSESSLIWVDNKYILQKGSQLVDKASPILGLYTDTSLWNKLAYYNYGKGDPPQNGKHLTDKNMPLFIDDRKVKYINTRERESLSSTIKNMDDSYYQRGVESDYEGFIGYAKNEFNIPEDNWLIRDYFDDNWHHL